MTLESLKFTVAQTRATVGGKIKRGTAFLVSRRLVLTCAHCLGSEGDYAASVDLLFTLWPATERTRTAKIIGPPNWELDVAFLELVSDAPVEPLPRCRTPRTGEAWFSWGHPSQVDDDGIVFNGTVLDPNTRTYHRDVMQLDCPQAVDRIRGASGSPVVIDGQIAGMLTSQLLEYADREGAKELKPAFRTLYALPLALIAQQPPFDILLRSDAPTLAERIVAAACARASALNAKRVAAEAKYDAARYVEREAAKAAFAVFLSQQERKCFLVVGKAGSGKTNIMSHLALQYGAGPALFYRGSVDDYSVEQLRRPGRTELVDPAADPGAAPRTFDELMEALRLTGSSLILCIDAINETRFAEIPARRTELQKLLEFVEPLPIRVLVSCRDVFWTYFIDPRGQSADFWWGHVHDPTYETRVQAEVDRRKEAIKQHRTAAVAASNAGAELIDDEQAKRIDEFARKAVEHRPSLLLGDLTTEELSAALGRYRISADAETLRSELRHPLFLRLYSEIASETFSPVERLTVGDVLARYVGYKIASVQRALPNFDTKETKAFLSRLTAEMRSRRHGRISSDRLEELLLISP